MTAKSTWTEGERRMHCQMCKSDLENRIGAACSKARWSMYISLGLLAACITLAGVAWSAKSDVGHQKETITDMSKKQDKIAEDISKIAEFVDLLKSGKIYIPRNNGYNNHNGTD